MATAKIRRVTVFLPDKLHRAATRLAEESRPRLALSRYFRNLAEADLTKKGKVSK